MNIAPHYYPQKNTPLDRVKFSFQNKLFTFEYQKRTPPSGVFITIDWIAFPQDTTIHILIGRLEDYYKSKAYTSE